MHTMQWNYEHKVVGKRRLADVIGEMSTNAARAQESGRAPLTPLTPRSDDDALRAEIRNFINEMEKLKVRQRQVEEQVAANEEDRQEMMAEVTVRMKD